MAADDPVQRYLHVRNVVGERAAALFERYAGHLQCRRGCYFCCDEITVLPIELEALRRWLDEHGRPGPELLGGPPSDRGRTPEAIVERDADRISADRSSAGRAGVDRGGVGRSSVDREGVDRGGVGRSSVNRDGAGHGGVDRTSVDRSRHGVFPNPAGAVRRCAFLGREGECTVYDARPTICRTHGLPLAYRVYEYDMHGREVRPETPEYTDLWCDLNFTSLGDADAVRLFDAEGRINMDEVNRRIEALNAEFLQSEAGARYRDLPPGEDRLVLGVLLRAASPTRRRPEESV